MVSKLLLTAQAGGPNCCSDPKGRPTNRVAGWVGTTCTKWQSFQSDAKQSACMKLLGPSKEAMRLGVRFLIN